MSSKVEEFLSEVTSKIHSRRARELSLDELRSHLLDKIDSLVALGKSYEDAESEAIQDMGSSQKICDEFSNVYRSQFTLKLAAGICGLFLMASIAATFYINFKAEKRWSATNEKAENSYEQVKNDVDAFFKLPFSPNALTDRRDAGTYLNPLLQKDRETKSIDLDRLLSYDYWELSMDVVDGKTTSPSVLYLYHYVKKDLVQNNRSPIQNLRIYRKVAELYYSSETIISTLIALALLEEERNFYEKSVQAGTFKTSDWKPVSEAILASAKRAVRGSNAYFGVFGNNESIPHSEQLCWAIGEAVVMANRLKPLLNGNFPLEKDYRPALAHIDHVLESSRPYCRLTYLRGTWLDAKAHGFDESVEIKPYLSKPLWYAVKLGPFIPYFRRVIAKVFASEFAGNWLREYDLKARAVSNHAI